MPSLLRSSCSNSSANRFSSSLLCFAACPDRSMASRPLQEPNLSLNDNAITLLLFYQASMFLCISSILLLQIILVRARELIYFLLFRIVHLERYEIVFTDNRVPDSSHHGFHLILKVKDQVQRSKQQYHAPLGPAHIIMPPYPVPSKRKPSVMYIMCKRLCYFVTKIQSSKVMWSLNIVYLQN